METQLAPDAPSVFADRNQLESVLLNLVVNARDAMPKGGLLRIEAANVDQREESPDDLAPGQYVALSVVDTGCGIAKEHLHRVFEPFFTTKDTGQGSGLGLSMVYGFVKQSGGHVRIDSDVGRGTRCGSTRRDRIRPAAAADAAATSTPAAGGPPHARETS